MFVKQKQPIEKPNSDELEENTNNSPKGKNIFEEIKGGSIENIMPPKVKSPPSLLSTDLFIKGNYMLTQLIKNIDFILTATLL